VQIGVAGDSKSTTLIVALVALLLSSVHLPDAVWVVAKRIPYVGT